MASADRSDERLSILYVGTLPPHNGGSAIAAAQVLIGLARLGHHVRAIAPITPEALAPDDRFALTAPEIHVRRYEVPHFEPSPDVPSSESYRELEREQVGELFSALAAERRPDVVVAGRESFARVVPALAKRHRLPCTLILSGATSAAILSGTYGAAETRQLFDGYRNVNLFVTPAEHLARALHGFELGEIRVIPNPVDLDRFRPRPRDQELGAGLGIADGDIVVAHISNLKPLKRPLDVVRSAERALKEVPRLFYLVVGDGPCRQEMEAASVAAGLRERFAFTGWVDYGRVPDYLSLADIVVLPSAFEAQALVYLETQACGRALLASDIAGAREVIVDGQTGVLFRDGDVGDLAEKTVFLARRADVRSRIGTRAREAVGTHSVSTVVEAFDGFLREVAGR